VRENKEEGREAGERSRCQIGHVPGKAPSSCAKPPKEKVDSFLLCERHALEAKLEGQIECWGGMLFHIDLWSREVRRRDRPDVVRLLEDQRTQATSARQRAYEDLGLLRSETPWERTSEPSRRGPLTLPPRAARRPFPGLGCLRRR
jgi:hypothetical protein